MNYYEHHIGDYDADTAHLTWLEDMAYTRLMRLYYRREQPIPADVTQACRLIRAVSKDERKAAETVLKEFFTLADDGWHQNRCDAEIGDYQKKVEHNQRVGKLGGRPRKVETQKEPTNNPPGYLWEPEQNPPQTPDPRPQTNTGDIQSSGLELRAARGDDEIPQNPADWIEVFASQHGVDVNHRSVHDRKKFFPLAKAWTAAGVTVGQMAAACAKAFSEAKEPIAWLPAYADRVLAGMVERTAREPPPEPEWRTEQRSRTAQAVPGIAAKKPGASRPDFIDVETRNVPSIAMG